MIGHHMNIPILFIHSSFEHLGCFHLGAIINNAIMTIHIQVFYGHVFICLEYIPGSGMAWSYGNSMFNMVRNYQIVF